MMLNTARLRHKVDIMQPVETKGSMGETDVAWQRLATVFADIQPVRGREYFEAYALDSEAAYKITIRYRADVTAKMRVDHGADQYEIDAPLDVGGRGELLELMCVRRGL